MVSGGAGEIETLRVFAAHVSKTCGSSSNSVFPSCNPMRALRSKKMLNLGNNHQGIPLSLLIKIWN
jgi:hypothetical protein